MNTLIDTKIKEYRERFVIPHIGMFNGTIMQEEIAQFLKSSLQDIEKHTREEEAKAYAKGLAVICEKYPSLATEIKAILYDS